GDGVDAVGEQLRAARAADAEHVAGGEAPLLHRGRGEGRKSDDVPGGIDVRHGRLEVLVDGEAAARIALEPGGFDVHQVGVALAADGVEEPVPDHALAAFEAGDHPLPVV